MKQAKNEIIETERANKLKYYLTIAEKENQSGIMFNDRLFFLLSAQHIGYMSTFNINDKLEHIDFQKAKVTVLLNNIKSISYKQKQLTVKFNLIQGNKSTQRKWIIRFNSQNLAKLWYTLIQKQKVQSTQVKYVEQPPKEPIKQKAEPITEQKDKKPFEIVSKNLQLNQKIKKQKDTKQIGTSISPKSISMAQSKTKKQNSQEQLAKILNQRSFGTYQPANSEFGNESKRKGEELTNLDETKRSQKISNYSQPPYKRAQNLIKKYVDVSEDHKNDSFKQNAQKLEVEISPIKKGESSNNQEDLPKINILPHLSNKKYYEQRENQEYYNYFKKTENVVKKSKVNERNFERLDVSSQIKKYSAQKSKPSSPSNSQKVHRYEFSVLKQKESGLPWTFRYIKYNHLIFDQFKAHCQKLLKLLIEDLGRPSQLQKYKSKLIKNNIVIYQINDLEVKLSLISLQDSSFQMQDQMEGMRVCNKQATKALQKQFNNFKALYEYLGNSRQLKVPMVCLCQYQGFSALFKILSTNVNKLIKTKQFKEQLDKLNTKSKIEINFNDTINNVVILLDENYYNNFKKEGDQDLDFRVYFIQEINNFLFPDLITDQANNKNLVLRKEIIETFQTESLALKSSQNYISYEVRSEKISKDQLLQLSKQLLRAISQCIFQLQSLRVYFMNSAELSHYFHQKGVNIRYLGHIYSHLKVQFQKRTLMTQMAARSCKSLLKKTLQDLILESTLQGQNDLRSKLIDFFNCIFGYTSETAQLWKVLSLHSQVYFGVSLNLHEIDRWFFVISLIQNCRLEVDWDKISAEQAFKTNQFFSEESLKGINYNTKIYSPIFSQQYQQVASIVFEQQTYEGFKKLNKILNLKFEEMPHHLKPIESNIKKYLAHFIPPQEYHQSYNHLGIYESLASCPSKTFFEILLIQIKWNLKLKQKDAYIRNCDLFIREVTKFYGEFHPIFTNLYDLFSAYHLTNCQFQDAITFAKSSLVNQLKICGTNHQKTSQCYYHLALCYIKANKREEAISHIKKSQQYFETNQKKETVAYAVMCLKLSLLYLNQNMIDSSVEAAQNSYNILRMFENQNNQFQDEETQCLQVMTRCYQIERDRTRLRQLATVCRSKLKSVVSIKNFQKLLKIYLFSCLSELQSSKASLYIDLIADLSPLISQNLQGIGYQELKQRLKENSFFNNLQTYLENINSVDMFIKQNQVMKNWRLFEEQYPRETVKDFLALTSQLLVFLGQAFVVGALRQAL